MATVKLNALVNKFRERLVKIVTNVFVFLFLVNQLVCKRKQNENVQSNHFFFQNRFNIYNFFFFLHCFIGKTYSTWDDNKYM